jgi:hypothetical protein
MTITIKTKMNPLNQDEDEVVYNCTDKFSVYELIICHKFPKVNTKIDELSYYITVNGDRVFYEKNEELDSNIYQPELIRTEQEEDFYVSIYKIKCDRSMLTEKSSDTVKLNLILPFDHNINILNLSVYGC